MQRGGDPRAAGRRADRGPRLHPRRRAILAWLALTLGAAWFLRAAKGRIARAVAEAGLHCGLVSVISLLGAVATISGRGPVARFVDGTLERIDLALRFDWLAWYGAVAAHPVLQVAGTIAYPEHLCQPRDPARLVRMAPPAIGRACVSGGRLADRHAHDRAVRRDAGGRPVRAPVARADPVHARQRVVAARADSGAAPPCAPRDRSRRTARAGVRAQLPYRDGGAVIATAWPIRRLRWPLLALNVAMLLSTPVEGTHYLADMLLGALVAAVSLSAVAALRSVREASAMRAMATRRPRLVR